MWAGTNYATAANASQDKLYLLKVGVKWNFLAAHVKRELVGGKPGPYDVNS